MHTRTARRWLGIAALVAGLLALLPALAFPADLTVTAASVKPTATTTFYKPNTPTLAAVTITAGQPVYINSSGLAALAYCNSGNGAGPWTESVVTGIAMNGATAGQPVQIATGGQINIGATTIMGQTYVCSPNNPGGVAPISDLKTAQSPVEYVSYLGQAVGTTGVFNINVNNTGINE